jgi:hypothetical protein
VLLLVGLVYAARIRPMEATVSAPAITAQALRLDPATTTGPEANSDPTPVSATVPAQDRVPTTPPTADEQIQPLSNPVVVLYGDSLAWESRDAFALALADHESLEVETRTFGGTAICDWLGQMTEDASTLAPGIVVVEFSGNSFTPCMTDVNGVSLSGPELEERYEADATTVINTFVPLGTQVVFAGAPAAGSDSAATKVGRLNAMYLQLAQSNAGVHYVDAGAAVLSQDSYTVTLPCLSVEPCVGGYDSNGLAVNVVRAPDGVHFCPVNGQAVQGLTDDCPVWSSGAFRYGTALAQPVIDSLALSVRTEQ